MAEIQIINGKRLSFVDAGAGEPLVLLHAFPLSSAMWRRQVATFASRHRVVAPDLPGFGQSEVISPAGSPMDRMGDSVEELMDVLHIARAVVGGCSMGGYAALALAQRYPKVVRGLLLTNTRANADTDAARANRIKTAEGLMARGMVEVEESLAPKMFGPDASAEVREEVLGMFREASPHGAAAASRGMATRADLTEWLTRCPVPVLVIHGEHDQVISRAESEAMARAAPRGELVVLPRAGHVAALEQPELWNSAVQKWMSALPR